MRKNRVFLNAVVVLIVASLLGFIIIREVQYRRDNDFICDTRLVVQKNDYKLSVVMSYYILQNHGYTLIKGILDHKDDTFHISRKNAFTFKKSQNIFYATSSSAESTLADNTPLNLLQEVLPAFYLHSDKKIEFSIYRQGWNGYIFSTGYVPSFYCKRFENKSGAF